MSGADPSGTAEPGTSQSATTDAPPSIRVVAGSPTDEELAATHAVIMAVIAERAARGAERVEPPVDLWRRSARGLRATVAAGPGAWAASRGLRGC